MSAVEAEPVVVASPFTEAAIATSAPYQRLLSDSLKMDLSSERHRVQTTHVRTGVLHLVPQSDESAHRGQESDAKDLVSWARRGAPQDRLRAFLKVERPRGGLPWETKNPGSIKVRGSNEYFLVVLAQVKTNTLKSHPLAPKPRPTRHKGRHRISKRMSDRIVELYEDGMSTREVAAQLAVSKTAVLQVLHRAGVSLRSRGGPRY